jgi:hypothetical protein
VFVAFNEIPQRELRDNTLTQTWLKCRYPRPVAFNEIPERELRALFANSEQLPAVYLVTLDEIPERELREVRWQPRAAFTETCEVRWCGSL